MHYRLVILSVILLSASVGRSQNVTDWSQGARVPETGRANILNLPSDQFANSVMAGKEHAQIYPITVTGVLPPFRPIRNFIEKPWNPLKDFVHRIVKGAAEFKNFDAFLRALGLHEYPQESDVGVYSVPYPEGHRPDYRMGFGLMERGGAQGFTFSCAACHSGQLFGKTVLGMSNRFPRANDFFVKAKMVGNYFNPWFFQKWTGANQAEMNLMNSALVSLNRVEVKDPLVLGLDTSLAQVSLSLNRRSPDAYATFSPEFEAHPRRDPILDDQPADSKPSVWWNLKYKNKWLSDGSVVSGNPIFTNIIWNEIGRGADLKILEDWLEQNQKTVNEITSAVFATEAPRVTDFFPAEKIDLGRAKAGEQIFNQNCASCHGHYEKAWSSADSDSMTAADRLKTVRVIPRKDTPIEDVGTDPYRRLGMKSLEQLNNLAISQKNGIVIKAQPGYVPPPLVGIWARWPYLHNNSIPNLCVLLTPSAQRPTVYYAGDAVDPARDFDFECNGYPVGAKTPKAWKENIYDTRRKGMSNNGHDEGIFVSNGQDIFSADEKRALISFLQTL